MPITIGPFDNVPAPGDPITSPWAQELSQYVSDRGRGFVQPPVYGGALTVTAVVDITGTITWQAVSNRFYRVRGSVLSVVQNTTQAFVTLSITDGANGPTRESVTIVPAGTYMSHHVEEIVIGASGTTTRKLRFAASAGNASVPGATTGRPMLTVEDLGVLWVA